MKNVKLKNYLDWKHAIQARLLVDGISRYRFIRSCTDSGIVTKHSGECLLANEGTVTGARAPSFQTAIDMANLAGYDVMLVPRTKTARMST